MFSRSTRRYFWVALLQLDYREIDQLGAHTQRHRRHCVDATIGDPHWVDRFALQAHSGRRSASPRRPDRLAAARTVLQINAVLIARRKKSRLDGRLA